MKRELISVLLADEHELYREALALTLEQSSLIRIAGLSGTGPAAEDLFRQLRPDILIIDITMRASKGLETSQHILDFCPGARIIWLSTFIRESYYNRAREGKIFGYLAKTMSYGQILDAIRVVHEGKRYLSR